MQPPTPAFALAGANATASPLLFDSPHSWRHWPDGVPTSASAAQLDTSWDAWVDEIWAAAADGAVPVLAARFHRAYIDANRARDDIDPALLQGDWPTPLVPSARSQLGMGLIRREVLPGVPMYAGPLAVADVSRRLAQCYDPYHERLAQLVAAAHTAHGFCVHVDCHSMKSVGNAMNEDCGQPRPDLVVSDLDGCTAGAALMTWLVDVLRERGYTVGINAPYRGGELLRRHGNPAAARHSVQIEIKRSLYMDEARCLRHAGFDRLVRQLREVVRRLADALDGELGAQLRGPHSPATHRSERA